MLNRRPHQKDLRKGRYSEAGLWYFLTTATKNREPLFLRPPAAQIVLNALKWLDAEGRITLFAAVVMPDHVHFVAQLKESRQDAAPTFSWSPTGRARGSTTSSFDSHRLLRTTLSKGPRPRFDYAHRPEPVEGEAVARVEGSRQDSGPTSRAMQPKLVGAPPTPQSVGAPSRPQSVGAPSRCDRLRKDAALTEHTILSRVMHSLKSFSANEINKALGRGGQVWERGYYEKGLRDEKALLETARYCLENPVREGLVDDFRRYPPWHCIYEV